MEGVLVVTRPIGTSHLPAPSRALALSTQIHLRTPRCDLRRSRSLIVIWAGPRPPSAVIQQRTAPRRPKDEASAPAERYASARRHMTDRGDSFTRIPSPTIPAPCHNQSQIKELIHSKHLKSVDLSPVLNYKIYFCFSDIFTNLNVLFSAYI